MDQDPVPQPAGRCTAAHIEDPTPCQGPRDAVTILDGTGNVATGCEHHGARMLASLGGAHIEPGSVVGAATRAFAASQAIRPFCWYETGPRTGPSQLSHAENTGRA
ncbi:hypothetical protein [Streptomyces sp. SP18CM02]|uniref:hypothetical protein n=1 Tax=Streptomyces sp. SP18CM02 TaxID=2758571 RepID=UPI00168ACBA3|nr:hypothetical protein [Streptomyces sp. SP18CM02]MBD3550848.1 hypothetical protein [Streptomyces sp. SP18CM02]